MLEGEINKLRNDIILLRNAHTPTKNLPRAITIVNPIRKNLKRNGQTEELFDEVFSIQKGHLINIPTEGKTVTEDD